MVTKGREHGKAARPKQTVLGNANTDATLDGPATTKLLDVALDISAIHVLEVEACNSLCICNVCLLKAM